MERVFNVLSDNQWHTLEGIAQITGDPTPSISAQIRHLRKARFGGHEIEKAYHGDGLYAYHLTGERITPASTPPENCAPLPPAAPELLEMAHKRISQIEGELEGLESFHCDIVAGCDIDKGPQGLFRQKRVVIGRGKTQDEIDLEVARLENARLRTLLEEACCHLDYRLLYHGDLPRRIAAALRPQISPQTS